MEKNLDYLFDLDKKYVWHPYDSFYADMFGVVAGGSGSKIRVLKNPSSEEVELIDATSSWWAVIHGYGKKEISEAIISQSQKISHAMFGGLTNEPAIHLCENIASITPGGLDSVFLSDSGSVAVEIAIKLAIQYWWSLGDYNRNSVLTWKSGYHGDTFYPMSLCDPDVGMHTPWKRVTPHQIFLDSPPCDFYGDPDSRYIDHIQQKISSVKDRIACVIVEPIVQGVGGMKFHNIAYLQTLREITDAYGIPLIFDEIATGFGRTGKMFACEHANVIPDIMCIGKGLTGGFITLAATITNDRIRDTIAKGDYKAFKHGPTFMGNALACAAANASIELMKTNYWIANVNSIEKELKENLYPLSGHKRVKEVRVLGAIGVIDPVHSIPIEKISQFAVDNGVWMKPFSNSIYCLPTYATTEEEIKKICDVMKMALELD